MKICVVLGMWRGLAGGWTGMSDGNVTGLGVVEILGSQVGVTMKLYTNGVDQSKTNDPEQDI
eukprot:9238493-Ditylum_brightwellii.AAC.1